MSNDMNISRIIIILLFSITFLLVGWITPVVYASQMPADSIVDVHDYEASNATVDDEYHKVCFERTVPNELVTDTVTEMFIVSEHGKRIEVNRQTSTELLEEGNITVVTERELPNDLRPGKYKYVTLIEVKLSNDRVTRTITVESNEFYITNSTEEKDYTEPRC